LNIRITPIKLRYNDETWSVLFQTDAFGKNDKRQIDELCFNDIRSVSLLNDSELNFEKNHDELFKYYEQEWTKTTHLKLQFNGLTADWAKTKLWGENQKFSVLGDYNVILEVDDLFNHFFRSEENIVEAGREYILPSIESELIEESKCTTEEKAQLKPLVDLMEEILLKVREKGMLSIKNEYDWLNLKPLFLSEALSYVLEGLYVDELVKVLDGKIKEQNCHGKNLLEMIIIRDGCLSIAKKMNPLEMKHHMSQLLG
jgi:hypothetical protein